MRRNIMAKEWREAFCPLCGRTTGMRSILRVPGKPQFGVEEHQNKWKEREAYNGPELFGVVKSSEGKGSIKMVRYYDIDEDTDGFFPPMKQRLLNVIRDWQSKGWLTPEDMATL